MQPSPFSFLAAAEPSKQLAPELIRCIIPFAALPVSFLPVTLSTDSGDQYVLTSLNIAALLVTSHPSIIDTPLSVSFSVANGIGSLLPFQSKPEAVIASVKSAFGSQSVHILCPWKPPAIAFLPSDSSCQPSSASFGLPLSMSLTTSACLTQNSHCLSSGIHLDFLIISGKSFPAFVS